MSRSNVVGLLILLISLVLSGCTDERIGKKDPKGEDTQTSPAKEYAIRAYRGPERELLLFPPYDLGEHRRAQAVDGEAASSDQSTQSAFEPARRTLIEDAYNDSSYEDNADTSGSLLMFAALECGSKPDSDNVQNHDSNPLTVHVLSSNGPWSGTNDWFLWSGPPTSCEELLALEEIMLCAAQKLSDLADAVAPVRWENLGTAGPLEFPPQSSRDRFIVRDLAIHMLANLAALDMMRIQLATQTTVCSAAWKKVIDDTQYAVDNGLGLFGTAYTNNSPYFPPSGTTAQPYPFLANPDATGTSRLQFNAHILRASGRLLKDLIEKSVYADIGGAEQQRAEAADPAEGARAMWGVGETDTAPYNSIKHGLRVLYGRWEMGARPIPADVERDDGAPLPKGDPRCSNRGYFDLLTGLNGPSTTAISDPDFGPASARWSDVPIRTPEQAYATSVIEQSGLFLPPPAFAGENIGSARAILVDQMLYNAAHERGLANPNALVNGTPFMDTPGGKAVVALVNGTSESPGIRDEDLRFGFERVLKIVQYQAGISNHHPYMTGVANSLGLEGDSFYFKPDLDLSPLVRPAGGLVIKGGIPRQDLNVDVTAAAGGAQVSSQCPEWVRSSSASIFHPNFGKVSAFQNSYMLANVFQQRLTALAEVLETVNFQLKDMSAMAAAEIRTWAGPGRIWARSPTAGEGGPSVLRAYLTGFTFEELGIREMATAAAQEAEIRDRIAFVYGAPRHADCAAGLRHSCAASGREVPIDAVLVQYNDDSQPHQDDRLLRFDLGFGVGVQTLAVDSGGSGSPYLQGTITGTLGFALHVVLRSDPENPSRGKVLGSIRPLQVQDDPSTSSVNEAQRYAFVQEAVSEHRRRLVNDLLGMRDTRPEITGGSMGDVASSCIPGIPADFFVPLESELTSDSDGFESSWRHYLALAEESAAKTDEIGREIIRLGLEKDLRREAAGEELGAICGDFAALDQISVEQGLVTAPESDGVTAACLNEPKIDLLFLTNDPFTQDTPLATIKEYLGCGTDDSHAACGATAAISHQGLNLAEHVSSATAPPGACMDLIGAQPDSQETLDLARDPQVSSSHMATLLGAMRLEVADDLHWKLMLNGETVMDTRPAAVATDSKWPSLCVQVTGGRICSAEDAALKAMFGGNCAGTTCTPVERNNFFRKVSGALWTMGAASGRIPAGLFSLPIPVARYNATGVPAIGDEPAPVIYGNGDFGLVSGSTNAFLSSWDPGPSESEAHRLAFGAAVAMHADFRTGVSQGTGSRAWVKALYARAAAAPARYLHVRAENVARATEGTDLASFIHSSAYRCVAGQTPPAPQAFYDLKYADPVGHLCNPPVAGKPLLQEVPAQEEESWDGLILMRDNHTPDGDAKSTANQYVPGWTGRHKGTLSSFCAESTLARQSGGLVTPGCLATGHPGSLQPFTQRALSPLGCGKNERAQLFVNSNDRMTGCEAGRELAAALGMTCMFGQKFRGAGGSELLPAIQDKDDIVQLEQWLGRQALASRYALSLLVLSNMPERVVQDFRSGLVGTGALAGEHGQLILQLENDIRALASGWITLSGLFDEMRAAIEHARIGLEAADLEHDAALTRLAMERIQTYALIAKGAVHAASGLAKIATATTISNPFGAIDAFAETGDGAIDITQGIATLDKLGELEDIQDDMKLNQVSAVLNELHSISVPLFTNMRTTLEGLRVSTGNTLSSTVALKQRENEAAYQGAKGSGVDFVEINGEPVAFPVNTVLNRQYSIAVKRYEQTLKQTRSLAYMARLAIEQRIGQRLNEIDEGVGPLPPPSEWAADVCTFSGVNYDELRAVDLGSSDGGSEPSFDPREAEDLTDPFIGDYVERLKNFVEFYNIEYPSHEADDVAVLSLRDDLATPGGRCTVLSKNLLHFSGALDAGETTSENGVEVIRGWQNYGCDETDASCLVISPGGSLGLSTESELGPVGCTPCSSGCLRACAPANAFPSPQPPPSGANGAGSFSWLHDVAKPIGPEDPADPTPVPSRSVFQEAELRAGTQYFLSWWDMARGPDGNRNPSTVNEYRAAVYDPNWNLVGSFVGAPFKGVNGGVWSDRRSIHFTTTSEGPHRVVFGASTDRSIAGSVAIANVQLEESTLSSEPGGYEATDSSRLVVSGNCIEGSPESFRSLFSYRCEDDDCFYELDQPVAIDTEAIVSGESKLAGKIARGNFNFRHIDVSVNLVGTGIRDCSQNPVDSCYGSGYIEYTLEHDAFSAGVIDYLGISRDFNFGSGAIRHGKALATERYITVPLGSADESLLNQPEIRKPEFRGRPLSGVYRVRIHDLPELAWDRVEDIQLVLTYRYWSRVQREGSTQ